VSTDIGFGSFVGSYHNLNIGNGTSTSITGLTANTAYYYRLRAEADCPSNYSNIITVVTALSGVADAGSISGDLAVCPSQNGVTYSVGSISGATGYVWSYSGTGFTITSGANTNTITANFSASPTPGILTVYGTNFCGSGIASTFSINTSCCVPFTDSRDSKNYSVVLVGQQCWMAENLAYLDAVVSQFTTSTTTPYKYVYGYMGTNVNTAKSQANYTTYGVLYNWPAAMNGSSSSSSNPSGVTGICPSGWHLPSDAEWTMLTDHLTANITYWCNSSNINTAKTLANTSGWTNTGTSNDCKVGSDQATTNNLSGYTAKPAGMMTTNSFAGVGNYVYFWSSTADSNPANVWYRGINYSLPTIYRNAATNDKQYGYSVRCVKN